MIAVSNTSPLTNLAAIDQFDLLQQLFSTLHIAEGVWAELNANGKARPGSREVQTADWIIQHTITLQTPLAELRTRLDRGEAESIVLALKLQADLILLDENEGRQVAQQLGLRPIGVLGILLRAKSRGLIDAVQPELDALRQQAKFYLSDTLYKQVLLQAGESMQ